MVLGSEEGFKAFFQEYEVYLSQVDGQEAELSPQGLGLRACRGYMVFWCFWWDDKYLLWPDGIVRYGIQTGFTTQQRQQILDAIAHVEAKTRIRFVVAPSAPRVVFRPVGNARECSSAVGMTTSFLLDQYINLGINCGTGTIVHEIGHTLGLWHEHSRCDRDTYVTVYLGNIDTTTYCTDGYMIGAYDYDSIMHYPHDGFAKPNTSTIVPRNGVSLTRIGQRNGLSPGDIHAINWRHGF
jgi:hypothetical protein